MEQDYILEQYEALGCSESEPSQPAKKRRPPPSSLLREACYDARHLGREELSDPLLRLAMSYTHKMPMSRLVDTVEDFARDNDAAAMWTTQETLGRFAVLFGQRQGRHDFDMADIPVVDSYGNGASAYVLWVRRLVHSPSNKDEEGQQGGMDCEGPDHDIDHAMGGDHFTTYGRSEKLSLYQVKLEPQHREDRQDAERSFATSNVATMIDPLASSPTGQSLCQECLRPLDTSTALLDIDEVESTPQTPISTSIERLPVSSGGHSVSGRRSLAPYLDAETTHEPDALIEGMELGRSSRITSLSQIDASVGEHDLLYDERATTTDYMVRAAQIRAENLQRESQFRAREDDISFRYKRLRSLESDVQRRQETRAQLRRLDELEAQAARATLLEEKLSRQSQHMERLEASWAIAKEQVDTNNCALAERNQKLCEESADLRKRLEVMEYSLRSMRQRCNDKEEQLSSTKRQADTDEKVKKRLREEMASLRAAKRNVEDRLSRLSQLPRDDSWPRRDARLVLRR